MWAFKRLTIYSKTYFPHGFAKVENLEYIGPIPAKEYWPIKKLDKKNPHEPWNDVDLSWNFKEVSIDYQKLDVISLGIIYMKYMKQMFKITGINASNKLTLPGLAYDYLMKYITSQFDIREIKSIEVDKWLKNSIIGGRTFIQKPQYKVKKYDEIIAK